MADLGRDSYWQQGPEFLRGPYSEWPSMVADKVEETVPMNECKADTATVLATSVNPAVLKRLGESLYIRCGRPREVGEDPGEHRPSCSVQREIGDQHPGGDASPWRYCGWKPGSV